MDDRPIKVLGFGFWVLGFGFWVCDKKTRNFLQVFLFIFVNANLKN
jgi:hypothetical protein